VLRADHYEAVDMVSKVDCIRALLPLGLAHVREVFEEKVCDLARVRYARLPNIHGESLGEFQLAFA